MCINILTLSKRVALAAEHPLSASNLARKSSASVKKISLSIAQLDNTFNDLRYNLAAFHSFIFCILGDVIKCVCFILDICVRINMNESNRIETEERIVPLANLLLGDHLSI
jgi:hypothetical protein